jgi:hypothetical protein
VCIFHLALLVATVLLVRLFQDSLCIHIAYYDSARFPFLIALSRTTVPSKLMLSHMKIVFLFLFLRRRALSVVNQIQFLMLWTRCPLIVCQAQINPCLPRLMALELNSVDLSPVPGNLIVGFVNRENHSGPPCPSRKILPC